MSAHHDMRRWLTILESVEIDEFDGDIMTEAPEPTWRYQPGDNLLAHAVSGTFQIEAPNSPIGKWLYNYAFIFTKKGEIEIGFSVDFANMVGRLHEAVEAGMITPEQAERFRRFFFSSGTDDYNMMGVGVARKVLTIMGNLTDRFISMYHPPSIMMVAETEQRRDIYMRLLSRLKGYRVYDVPNVRRNGRGKGFVVYAKRDTMMQKFNKLAETFEKG